MTRTLYQLTEAYKTIETMLDSEELSSLGDIQGTLDNIKEEIGDKVENITKLVLSLQADAKVIKEEEDRLQARRGAMSNRVAWLKEYMLTEMNTVGIDKIKRELFTVSVQASPPSVEITDLDQLPKQYLRIFVEPKKKDIIDYFKETGEIISGTNIITGKKHLVIR